MQVLIFCETKRGCDDITRQLRQDGWPALALHGDKSQKERDWVLLEFKSGRHPLMLATDVAARGLGTRLGGGRTGAAAPAADAGVLSPPHGSLWLHCQESLWKTCTAVAVHEECVVSWGVCLHVSRGSLPWGGGGGVGNKQPQARASWGVVVAVVAACSRVLRSCGLSCHWPHPQGSAWHAAARAPMLQHLPLSRHLLSVPVCVCWAPSQQPAHESARQLAARQLAMVPDVCCW